MSTNALNQVYKSAVLAVEECALSADASIAATSLSISGNYMSNAPFVVGREYIIQDNSFSSGVDGVPNAERILVESVSGLTATAKLDGIGYAITGTLTIVGYVNGVFTGGLVNAYTVANHASILTPGQEIAIQSSDFNCRFLAAVDAPKINMDDEASRFATGDEGRDPSIAIDRSATIDVTEKIGWAGAVTTIPTWAKMMRITGHVMKKYSTHGIGFLAHPWSNEVTGTVWVFNPENGMNPTTTVFRYCGVHGDATPGADMKKTWTIAGKLMGAYVTTTELPYTAARVLTSPDTNVPETLLLNTCTVPAVFGKPVSPHGYATVAALVTGETLVAGSTFYSKDGGDTVDAALTTAKGSAVVTGDTFTVLTSSTCGFVSPSKQVQITTFSLEPGGVVNPFIDQSTTTGNAYFSHSDRDPKLSINPYLVRKSANDIDFVCSNMITGPVTIQGVHLSLNIPNGQLLSPAYGSREGYQNINAAYRALRNDIGAGKKDSTLPALAMYELLIGTRA